MRIACTAIAIFSLSLSITALGQQAKLEGHVYEIVNTKKIPVAGVKVISPGGQSNETDSQGHFVIDFPNSIKPGHAMRIEVSRAGWVVRDPLFGDCTTKNPAFNYEILIVIIVPKGSPLALEPKQLSKVIDRWAKERVKLRGQVNELGRQLDEYAFLREYTEKYGVTLEQFKAAADQWAKTKESDDKEEQALKERWLKNYGASAQLFREAALGADEEYDQQNKERIETGRKVIRRFQGEGNAFYENDQLREALAAYNEIEKRFIARKFTRDDYPEEWAETKVLLGVAKSELEKRVEGYESQILLAEAMQAYREALMVYTREQFPENWGLIQNNLGVTLYSQGKHAEGAAAVHLLGEAVQAFREALKVYTAELFPQDWAMTQNNLGAALQSQSERAEGAEVVQLLREAVQAFREALTVRTREQFPPEWAATWHNLGIALYSLGKQAEGAGAVRLLGEAVQAYREALTVRTREQFPPDWAATQDALGTALVEQVVHARDSEKVRLLGEAVQAYREALKVYTRELFPQDWAMTQNNLGAALQSYGERAEGGEAVQAYREATQAYREELKVYTREHFPQQWAMAQNNLGIILSILGKHANGDEKTRLLGEAVQAYREALKVYTRGHVPQRWATAQNNLGAALQYQSEQAEGAEAVRLLGEAAQAYREALTVRAREHFPQDWAMTQYNLGITLRARGEQVEGVEAVQLLSEAAQACREALKVYTREQFPQQWAMTQNSMGKALFLLKNWKEAAFCFENVLALYPGTKETYHSLAFIYHEHLFEYGKAFDLHIEWLSQFPKDVSILPDVAEALFTTGRFDRFPQIITVLLRDPELPTSTKVALQMIDVANTLALKQPKRIPASLDFLIKTIASQKEDFRIEWTFNGTLHFINQHEGLAAYRTWLNSFFAAAQENGRDAILKKLREAQASFKPSEL